MTRRALLVALAIVPSCSIDFDRFVASDASVIPGADTPAVTGDRPVTVNDVPAGAPCMPPYIIASVEALSTAAISAERGGYVARFSLATHSRCSDLTAGGMLPNQPFAVTQLTNGRIGVAFTNASIVLDPNTGAIVSTYMFEGDSLPADAFPLQDDRPLWAVAYRSRGSSQLAVLGVFDDMNRRPFLKNLNDYSALSATASPVANSHYLLLGASTRATVDVADGLTATPTRTPYTTALPGNVLRVFSLGAPGPHLTTFMRLDGAMSGALAISNPSGTRPYTPPTDALLFGCDTAPCRSLVQVVPNPMNPNEPIGLCDSGNDTQRNLVLHTAAASDPRCLLFDGATLSGGRTRISYISVATR